MIESILNASTTQLLAPLVRYQDRIGVTEHPSHTAIVDIFGVYTSRIIQKISATSSKIRPHRKVHATKATATGWLERDIMKGFGREMEPQKVFVSRVPTVHSTLRMYLILHRALLSLMT